MQAAPTMPLAIQLNLQRQGRGLNRQRDLRQQQQQRGGVRAGQMTLGIRVSQTEPQALPHRISTLTPDQGEDSV